MSTETMESVGTATFTEIVEAMDFHLPCEHHAHDIDKDVHEGHAEWIFTERCACGTGGGFACDKFVKHVEATRDGTELHRECLTPLIQEWVRI